MTTDDVDKQHGDEPSEPAFMTLIKTTIVGNGDQTVAQHEIALKIEPVFKPDYKPGTEPGAPRKLVNVMQMRNCTATALAVHDRIIAVGSSSGLVVLSDPLGNVDHKNKVFHIHSKSVVALDIDASGEFVASGGEDGRVVVLDLGAAKDAQLIQLTHQRPVRAVAIDSEFNHAKDRRLLVACGGSVILYVSHKPSLFSSNEPKVTVLVDNVISILRLAWQPQTLNGSVPLIAWANERGDVVLYDEKRKMNAGLIRPEPSQIIAATTQSNKVSATFSQISLVWLPQMDSGAASSILVVCGSLVRIFLITGGDDPRGSDIVTPRVHICTHRFTLESDIGIDSVITSIGSFPNSKYVACCLNSKPYQLILCPIGDGKAQPLLNFPLPSNGHELVAMGSLPFDGQTYALFKDGSLIAVKLCLLNDDILTDYVDYLLKIGDASGAAALLPLIFDSKKASSNSHYKMNKISWDDWLAKFDQLGQIPAVSAYLPIAKPSSDSGICFPSKERYDMVLTRVLACSPEQFESLIVRLSPDLYSTDAAMKLVSDALVHDPRNPNILASLAFLCCSKRDFERAVNLLLELKHQSLFQIIDDNSLYYLLQKRVTELVACSSNPDIVVRMLIAHLDKFPPISVISQLKSSFKTNRASAPALLAYLKRMFNERPGDLQQTDIDLLVALFAELDSENLLNFLRSDAPYRLENALSECKKQHRHRECIYLLGKGGKMVEAIDVIIKEFGSIGEAVEFCREKGGEKGDLWMILAERVALHRPDLIADLLRQTGTELLDPAEVIKLIPAASGRLVPGLRQALEGSLSDSERQLNLLASAENVVANDLNLNYKEISSSAFSATTVVDDKSPCQECREPLWNNRSASMRLIVFECRHAFHYACLPNADETNCPVCYKVKDRSTSVLPAAGQRPTSPNSVSPIRLQQQPPSTPTIGPGLPFTSLLSGLAKTTVR